MIAVCGLDCKKCEIYRIPIDPLATDNVYKWFKEMEWLKNGEDISNFLEKAPYCLGCRNDRGTHWSPDCWILRCCIDEKGFEYCFECGDFPCERLYEWGKESIRRREALEKLRYMKSLINK